MIKDTVASLKANIMERFSSPLVGTFILSWVIWNWKLVATLTMGKEATAERIDVILKKYYDLDHLIKLPALSSIAFIVAYPIVSTVALVIWEWVSPVKRRIKAYFEDKTPLTREEARLLRASLMEREREMEKLWEGKETEIKDLKAELEVRTDKINSMGLEISSLESTLSDHSKELEALRQKSINTDGEPYNDNTTDQYTETVEKDDTFYVTDEQRLILTEVASSNNNSISEQMLSYDKGNTTRLMYNLDILMDQKLVKKDYSSGEGDYIYSFTPKGRAFVVENGLA